MWPRACLAAIGLLASTGTAIAQSAEAESLFNDGDKLMSEGKLAEACNAFEASNRIEPRAGTLIRLGECRESNHQIASAWSAFKDALTRVKDPKKKVYATSKVSELEPKLSMLTLRVTSRVDGLQVTRNGKPIDAAAWDRSVAVDGGVYQIGATAPNRRDWHISVTVPDVSGTIAVDIPTLDELPPKQTAVVPVAPVVHPSELPAEASVWTGRRKAAVAAGGVAIIGAGAGAILGVLSNHARDDADRLCPQAMCTSTADVGAATRDHHTAQNRALEANVSYGVAAAAAIGAGVLWWAGAPGPAHGLALAPSIAPGSITLTISSSY